MSITLNNTHHEGSDVCYADEVVLQLHQPAPWSPQPEPNLSSYTNTYNYFSFPGAYAEEASTPPKKSDSFNDILNQIRENAELFSEYGETLGHITGLIVGGAVGGIAAALFTAHGLKGDRETLHASLHSLDNVAVTLFTATAGGVFTGWIGHTVGGFIGSALLYVMGFSCGVTAHFTGNILTPRDQGQFA